MKMVMKSLIPAITLAAFATVASSAAYAQGTPDEETPANEGVCDELKGGTPGLYGLCVGFCEAQDCEATLDAVTGNVTFDPSCKPSSPRLLTSYDKRAQPGDPPMPCVNVTGECPCWTVAEIDTIGGMNVSCGETVNQTRIIELDPVADPTEIAAVDRGTKCFYQTRAPDIQRILEVPIDTYVDCRDSIRAECAERGCDLPLSDGGMACQ